METRDKLAVENILRYLSKPGRTQTRLAQEAKIGAVTLNRILKGKRGLGAEAAEKLAKAMHCSISALYSPNAWPAEESHSDSKDALILRLIALLPTLNESQIRSFLSVAEAAQASLADHSVSPRKVR